MTETININVNGQDRQLQVDPETPLIYILRNDLGLKGPKLGCGQEQCGACKVLVDGQAVPSCELPVKNVIGLPVVTLEGLGTAGALHPLQETFIEEQAIQCGYCTAGMIVAAQGLLNLTRYPTDDEIREALADNLCRCGVYDRVRRAIKLRIGREEPPAISETRPDPLAALVAPSTAQLPESLQQSPEIDAWIRINSDATVTVFTGKVEFGQGIKTAVAQIAADELDVSLDRIRVVMADTALTPNEGLTVSSMSLQTSGNAIRYAAAEARHILLSIAFEELEAPIDRLVVEDGLITDPVSGRSVSYWDLLAGKSFGRRVTGAVQPKRASAYNIVGQPAQRLDLLAKVTGGVAYVHDLDLPGMVHGRIVRPPNQAARLISVDEAPALALPGVLKVVRDGSFLAVLAEREEQAVKAMELLRQHATWQAEGGLPPLSDLHDHMLRQPDQAFLVIEGTPGHEPVPPITTPEGTEQRLSATYLRPYHMHASMGPSAAVAHLVDGKLTVWAHSQGAFPQRTVIAQALEMDPADVRVIHMEGAGCYGHNGSDDAAFDAALLALALPGRPVSLKWTRADENAWEPYSPAMVVRMEASLDAAGGVIDWNHDVWSYTHLGRAQPDPVTSGLVAAWHRSQPRPRPPAQPRLGKHVGIHRNADPIYAFLRRRVVKHFLPDSPFRTSSTRGLGAYANVFAIESFIDELATAAGEDPVAFRLKHLADERGRAVVSAAAQLAGWESRSRPRGDGYGRGFAFARYKNMQCYAAVVVDLEVDRQVGEIRLQRAYIAADAGLVVNPNGLSNQLEGGLVQSASWTLYEQVTFGPEGITSLDWETYPILGFPNAPRIETMLLNRPDHPFLGSGEATQGPTPAAIANAVYDAAGIRLRHIPFTPEKVLAALAASR